MAPGCPVRRPRHRFCRVLLAVDSQLSPARRSPRHAPGPRSAGLVLARARSAELPLGCTHAPCWSPGHGTCLLVLCCAVTVAAGGAFLLGPKVGQQATAVSLRYTELARARPRRSACLRRSTLHRSVALGPAGPCRVRTWLPGCPHLVWLCPVRGRPYVALALVQVRRGPASVQVSCLP